MNNHPLVIFAYQRPESVKLIIKLAIKFGIDKIYLFIDGPKKKKDIALINQTIKVVKKLIKENSQVKFIFKKSSQNLGLQTSIIQGLNQVFAEESAAIILEDDCIPALDFFKFTNQMLTKYKANPKIMSITGSGLAGYSPYSYDFSRYQQVWGWATWKRAWQYFDPDLKELRHFNQIKWSNFYLKHYFKIMIYLSKVGQVKSWAFKWSFAHFINQSLAILPSANLINNIGFDGVATNTKTKSPLLSIPITKIKFPLTHPKKITENIRLSRKIQNLYYQNFIAFLGMIRQLFYYLIKKLCA